MLSKKTIRLHSKLCNINLLNVAPSLVSRNPREHMFSFSISLLVVTFPSHISHILTLKQTTKKSIHNVEKREREQHKMHLPVHVALHGPRDLLHMRELRGDLGALALRGQELVQSQIQLPFQALQSGLQRLVLLFQLLLER